MLPLLQDFQESPINEAETRPDIGPGKEIGFFRQRQVEVEGGSLPNDINSSVQCHNIDRAGLGVRAAPIKS